MITFTNKETAIQVPFKIDGKIFHKSDRIETILLTLKQGEKMDQHNNPFDVLFFVVSGKGTLTTPEKDFHVEKNHSIYVTKEELRGWENKHLNPLEILVVKIFD